MRGNGLKLHQGRFKLDFRKIFFLSERVVRQWHRLCREAMELASVEVLKKHADEALRDMVSGMVGMG